MSSRPFIVLGDETSHGRTLERDGFNDLSNVRLRDEQYSVVALSGTLLDMRLLVCVGRDYRDSMAAFRALDRVMTKRKVIVLIHGAAPGADSLAAQWANDRNIEAIACPAEWAKHGKRAGPLRNAHMLTLKPDGVVAFPGGRGTEDVVKQAQQAGIPVWRPYG